MGSFPNFRRSLLGFLVVLSVFAATQCQADEQVIEVVGTGECADCIEKKIQTNHAFPGLHVTIDCKNQIGHFERWGVGELNEEGKFKVSLPKEMLNDGNLKHECYAQLHSASSAPCPAQNGLKSTKIVAKNDADGKHITFEPAQKLTFSTEVCTSATFLPPHKPFPKLPKIHLKHHYKFPPILKKPLPPMFPTPVPKTPKPPVTIPKTPEPPVSIPKTPEPPVTKPEPPTTVPKKPEPPSMPKKPCPPEPKKKSKPGNPKKDEPKKKKPEKPKKDEPKKKIPEKPKKEEPKKPMPPVVKPPVVTPPVVHPPIVTPPIVKPPIKKLPCPPIFPKLPPKDYHHPKLPPFPTIPPKFFHHPILPHLSPPPYNIPHA